MNAATPLKVTCRQCKTRLDMSELEPFTVVECPVCGTRLRVPKFFDRYLLEKVCGSGRSTTVYRALDPRLSRRVAVKVLNASSEDADEMGRRFLAEAKLVAGLNHPGIMPVYNCGVCEGKPYLVTRFMERGDLGGLLRRGELPPPGELFGILAAAAEALAYANNTAKLVHHDVKPSSILLSSGGEVRLGDFDLADVREFGDQSPCVAEWGSPACISPERLGSGGEDVRGDIFSLGATIYELLCGRPPFGVDGEPEELYERRRAMAFTELGVLRPDLPGSLTDLVSHMLDFEPDCRPAYPEIVRELKTCAARFRSISFIAPGVASTASFWGNRKFRA